MKQTTGKIYICDYCGRKITNPRAYDKYMYTYRKRYLAERKGIEVYDDERVETFQCEEMPAEATGGCEKYKNYVLARLK